MKSNKLRIRIKKPVDQVFKFTITPPNSTLWIKSVIKEETNQWPVQVGTVYKLYDKNGKCFEVVATVLKENDMVEWVSKDHVYHCRYSFKSLDKKFSGMFKREILSLTKVLNFNGEILS